MYTSRFRILAPAAALLTAATLFAASAHAALLVDRGLPTENLNNAAGSDRANVSWVPNQTYDSSSYWLYGDTFQNTSSQTWHIDTIRLWVVETAPTSTTLWGGLAGGAVGSIATNGTITETSYAGGSNYQGQSTSFFKLYQVDFTVDILLGAGDTYEFYLDGLGSEYELPWLHASNAALSDSPQDGADDSMLYSRIINGAFDTASRGSWTSLGNGWDKASDFNIQVYGNAVPEPATLALFGVALLGAAAVRRRRT